MQMLYLLLNQTSLLGKFQYPYTNFADEICISLCRCDDFYMKLMNVLLPGVLPKKVLTMELGLIS